MTSGAARGGTSADDGRRPDGELDRLAEGIERLRSRLRELDAGRPAGLSEGVDEAIRRLAGTNPAGAPRASLRGVGELLDRLARELDNADETARALVEGPRASARHAAPPADHGLRFRDENMAAITGRPRETPPQGATLDEVRRTIDALLAGTPERDRVVPARGAQLDAALRQLEARIGEARSRTGAASAAAEDDRIRLEGRLADIAARLADTGPASPAPPAAGPPVPPPPSAEPAVADALGALTVELSALGRRLGEVARVGVAPPERPLPARRAGAEADDDPPGRALLRDIRASLDRLAATAGGAARETTVVERLDALVACLPDAERLDALAAEVAALRRMLVGDGSLPAVARIEARLDTLAADVEASLADRRAAAETSSAGVAATLADIRGAIEDLTAGARPSAADADLAAVAEGVVAIRRLVEARDGHAADDTVALARMETRLDALARSVEALVAVPGPLDELRREVAALGEMAGARDAVGLARLERQFGDLAGRVDAALARTAAPAALAGIEARVAGLAADLERATPRAASLKQIEENLSRLQAEMAEGRTAAATARAAVGLAKPLASPAPVEAAASAAGVVPAAPPLNPAVSARRQDGEGLKPDIAALRELAASASDPERPSSDRRADFIAAARRAARAATVEADRSPEPDEPAPEGGAFSRIGQAIRNRRRPLLLTAAAIILALSVLHLSRTLPASSPAVPVVAAEAPRAPLVPAASAAAPAVPAPAIVPPEVQKSAVSVPVIPSIDRAALVAPPADARAAMALATPPVQGLPGSFSPASESPVPTKASGAVSVSADPVRAAAEAGDPAALFEIASRYAEGRNGVSRNLPVAAEWYQRAAAKGVVVAAYRLGSLYERGQGVPKNPVEAVAWYARAADAGNVGAMHNLAVLLSEGAGGPPDAARALDLFRAAANYGVRDSQYNLGVIYARGLGPEADLVESYKWFAVAAAGGDTDAATRRDEVAASMNAGQLAEARAGVAAFAAQTPPAEANRPPALDALVADDAGRTIGEADRIALVRKIQVLLAEQGYDPGPADGVEGPKTQEAVRAFQRHIGTAENGVIDRRLVAALGDRSG